MLRLFLVAKPITAYCSPRSRRPTLAMSSLLTGTRGSMGMPSASCGPDCMTASKIMRPPSLSPSIRLFVVTGSGSRKANDIVPAISAS